ncbi:MAG: hypothetical protein SOZ34_05730 [Clostridia bacterium]|nr:hypothetical protein [Clostridia bacterium]
MKKILTKALTVVIALSCTVQSVLALSDYENIYDYKYMDDVFRFDVGEFTEKSEEESAEDVSEAVKITNGIGLTEITQENEAMTYEEYVKIMGKLGINTATEKNITMHQLAVDLVSMLCFDKAYPNDDIEAILQRENLIKGITYKKEAPLENKAAAVMLLNALESRYVIYDIDGSGAKISFSEVNYMEEKLGLTKVSGLLDSVYKKSILSSVTPRENVITIDRTEYMCGDSKAKDFFGRRVTAYIHYDGYDYTVKYISDEYGSKFFKLDLRDVYDIDSAYIYYDTNGKEGKIKLSGIKYLNVNGDAKNIEDIGDYLGKAGNISLSHTQRNSGFDICMLEIKEHFTISSASSYDNKIVLTSGMEFKGQDFIDVENADYCEMTKNNEPIKIDDLNYNDCLTVVSNADASYVDITVSDKKVQGDVAKIEDNIVYIGNEKYWQAESFIKTTGGVKSDFMGTFYLSEDGYILNYKSGTTKKYGYMRRIRMDDDEEDYFVDIFSEDGKWYEYTLKENVIVDDERVSAEVTYSILKDLKNTVVYYNANNRNVISEIETVRPIDGKIGSPVVDGTVKQSWKGGIWFRSDMGYRFEDTAVLFQIPEKEERLEEYKVRSSGYLKNDEEEISIIMYSPDELGFCPVGIIDSKLDELDDTTKYCLFVEKTSEGISEEDEPLLVLKGTRLTVTGQVAVEPDFEFKMTQTVKDKLEEVYPNAFRPGTLMYYATDSEGYIQNARVEFTDMDLSTVKERISGNIFQYFAGTVTYIDAEKASSLKGYFKVVTDSGTKDFVMSAQNLILIDTEETKARKITCGELRVGDRMFVSRAFGEGRVCAVIR